SDLIEDYLNQKIQQLKDQRLDRDLTRDEYAIVISKGLADIERYLAPYGKTLLDFSITRPDYSLLEAEQNFGNLIAEELNYNINSLNNILDKENLLNTNQKLIYDTIIKALNNEIDQTVFFVDGPGGYGKTFLFNMLLAKVRSE